MLRFPPETSRGWGFATLAAGSTWIGHPVRERQTHGIGPNQLGGVQGLGVNVARMSRIVI